MDAWSKGITYHWRKFWGATLKSGDHWRRQDLVRGAHDDRGAKGAQWGDGVCGGCPLPSRLEVLGERREYKESIKYKENWYFCMKICILFICRIAIL